MKLTERQKDRILRLAEKHTVPEIAKKMKVSQPRVRRVLAVAGVQARSAVHHPLADVAEVKRVLKATGSYEATATHFGVTRQAVYNRVPTRQK